MGRCFYPDMEPARSQGRYRKDPVWLIMRDLSATETCCLYGLLWLAFLCGFTIFAIILVLILAS